MMNAVRWRWLFLMFCLFIGATYDFLVNTYMFTTFPFLGTSAGISVGLLVICFDILFRKVKARSLLSFLVGVLLAVLFTKVLTSFLVILAVSYVNVSLVAILTFMVCAYCFTMILLRSQDEYQLIIPFVKLKQEGVEQRDIILDTSVIIDGRIADMCNTTFLSGRLIIPEFVLKELQAIADSSDSLKRNRGRRGLEVLNRIKTNSRLKVVINDMDFPEISAVDAKLVKLAAQLNARIFTNDYNLSKIAELQNVDVLNINELSNALKPVVLPGEIMEVKVIKEGKESSQGVAYLDDGTMIVVENGRRLIGKTVQVVVTSAYQTQAGRMIFAKREK